MTRPSSKEPGLSIVLIMLVLVALPAALALSTVRPALVPGGPDRTPYGYTISLLFFIFPIGILLFWLVPREHLRFPRITSGITLGILVPAGCLLEFFCAPAFFRFPNPEATLRLRAPAWRGAVPVEEYAFYLTGFATILFVYVWLGEYWFRSYNEPDYSGVAKRVDRLLRFHPASMILGALFFGLALVYKKFVSRHPEGFPGYFTVLVLLGFVPAMGFFQAAKPLINWRAFGLTLFYILFVSLLWESTLAIPYGWWNYQHRQMLGIFIRAWGDLPIEAVFVWVAVTFATAIVFEVVKVWQASGRTARHAFLGPPASGPGGIAPPGAPGGPGI